MTFPKIFHQLLKGFAGDSLSWDQIHSDPVRNFMKHTMAIRLTKLITLLLLVGLGKGDLFSQEQKPLRLGLGMFGTAYRGDLTIDGEALHRFYPGFNVSLQFASEKLITPQLNFGFGRFVAQNRNLEPVGGISPNTFTDTRIFFVDFRLKARFLRTGYLHPYLATGIGLLGYTPKDAEGKTLLENFTSRQEGETYGTVTASFPLSLGIELDLHPLLTWGLEYSFRPTSSDYLDNISALGQRSGNDQLHLFTMSLYATFDPSWVGKGLRGKDR